MRDSKRLLGAAAADRGPYIVGQERLAQVRICGTQVEIVNLRDSVYPATDEVDVRWVDRSFDLKEVTNLWVVFGFFSRFRGIAHTELTFEFADNNNLGASFEIRALQGQRYSPIAGLGKTFELTLRWATERDSMMRRCNRSKIDTELFMIEAEITQSRIVELFLAASRHTNELFANPEWYHSLTNTCATNLVDLVHEVLPGQLQATPRVLLPGSLANFWAKQGVLKLSGSLEETMAASFINDRCVEIGDVADFSARLHHRV